jgi:predicted GTPase
MTALVVVTVTAAQVSGIVERRHPAELAGPRHPDRARGCLRDGVRGHAVDLVAFTDSDGDHEDVTPLASRALAPG